MSNDPSGLTSKGYCFVEYRDPAHTQVAITGLNGFDIGGGKILTARVAAARDDVSTNSTQAATVASGNNIVGGYDVEALIDAAMGLKPMPTAAGLTGGSVMMMAPAAAMPMNSAAPAAMVNPVDIANQALEAALNSSTGGNAAAPSAAVTRILVLSNMVTDEDLKTEEDHQALVEEVRQECAKFGTLTSMQIPRPTDANVNPSAIRKVFLEYASPQDAQAANRELAGRQFGALVVEVCVCNGDFASVVVSISICSNTVAPTTSQTSFFPEADYLKGNLF